MIIRPMPASRCGSMFCVGTLEGDKLDVTILLMITFIRSLRVGELRIHGKG